MAVSIRLMKKLATLATRFSVTAIRNEPLQAGDVRLRDLLVNFLREQQCHVDVDPFADQLLDCGHAPWGRWDFDHQIVTAHSAPQSTGLVECAGCVVREER